MCGIILVQIKTKAMIQTMVHTMDTKKCAIEQQKRIASSPVTFLKKRRKRILFNNFGEKR